MANASPSYQPNPVHRNGSLGKSQWRISISDEVQTFTLAYANSWVLATEGWGFHFVEGSIEYLGVAQDHITQVFLAKFVNDVRHQVWHGYPADYQNHPQDIPDDSVRRLWIEADVLPAAKVRKIGKGQPCKL